MEKLRRSLGSFAVPLLSILLAFIIGGIIMAALGADPFTAVKFLFQGAFGSRANIGTTLNKATPLMFTALCACFAYKCGVFNLGGEGQFLMGSIAAFLTAYFSGLTGFCGNPAGTAGRYAGRRHLGPHPRRAEDHPRPERDDYLHYAELCGHAVHGRALYQLDPG